MTSFIPWMLQSSSGQLEHHWRKKIHDCSAYFVCNKLPNVQEKNIIFWCLLNHFLYCMLKYYVYILFGDNALTSWLVQWSYIFEHRKWSTMYMPIWTVALHCSFIPVICSKQFLGVLHTLHHTFKFCDQAYYKSVIISQCQSETISSRWSIKIKIARDAQTHLVKYKIT